MRCRNRSLAVCSVILTLTACGSSAPPPIPQTLVLPAEYSTRCPPVIRQANSSADAAAIALEGMYKQYGLCAGRLIDLIDYINNPVEKP